MEEQFAKLDIRKDENIVYKRTDLLVDRPLSYCPGCGHGVVHRMLMEVIEEMDIQDKTIGISPVGCSVLAYDFLLSGSDRSSLRLQSGDVIYVPIVQSMAAIAGNVRRCGLYELKGKTQLSDLIKLAGGLTPSAWSNRIQVERFINRQFQGVLDIESSNDDIPQFEILDGDIVKIFPILLKDKNAVYLSGNVLRPGKYEFRKGMRINDIIHGYPELLPETYFNYAIILRQNPETFSYQIFPFNLRLVLDTPSLVSSNILLEHYAQIRKLIVDSFQLISFFFWKSKSITFKIFNGLLNKSCFVPG